MAKPNPSREELLAERDATQDHRMKVYSIMQCLSNQLLVRGKNHDRSKLTDKELPYFAAATALKELPYGSKKYNDQISIKSALRPALDHHYKNNRHHPEHHKNGIEDMNLIDILEMLSDWLAAGLRHGPDHNIFNSINVNRYRFRIKKDLAKIMWSTAIDVFGEEPEQGYEMCLINECKECGEWFDPQHTNCPKCYSLRVYEV